jgi:hypothetical protein
MMCKAYQLIIQGLAVRLSAFALCLAFSSTAMAGITLSSLPYVQNFDSPTYVNTNPDLGLVWTTQGATHTWMESAGWGGSGAAKFTRLFWMRVISESVRFTSPMRMAITRSMYAFSSTMVEPGASMDQVIKSLFSIERTALTGR